MQKRLRCNRFERVAAAHWLCRVAMLLVLLSAPARADEGNQDQADLEGLPIAVVRIVDEAGHVLEENPAASSLKAGQPYDSLILRDSLRALHETGRFAEIRAEATRLPEGVRVDFVVRQNLYFNRIRVEGLSNDRLVSRAISALQLNLGEIFTEERVAEGVDRLRETLLAEGYYEEQLTHELMPHPETRQMDVIIHVKLGRRARISSIQLANKTPFPDKEILRKSRLKRGQQLTPRRRERAGERVRSYLSKKGLLGAQVSIRRGAYDASTHSVPIEMEVLSGLRAQVEIAGASVPERQLKQLIPIYQEGTVDEDLLQEGRRNLRNYFEREGFFDTTVSVAQREDKEKNQSVITYTVDRGSRRRLVGLEFKGNQYFSSSILREQVSIRPASFADRGRFSRRALADDEENLQALYAANGFQNATVKSEIIEKYQGKDENLFVRFLVTEGAQTRVGDLRIEGAEKLDAETLAGVSGSTSGQPYSEFNVASDRDNILATYFNEGFPDARFEARVEPAKEPNRVNLVYHITEGPQTRITTMYISGNDFTRQGVIERELLVHPPEPLRQGEVVESQRNLYNLGIFSRVQIAPQNPEGTERDKTLVVLVDEAKRYTIAYGAGIEFQRLGSGGDPVSGAFRASPRGLFEISRGNFLGRAHTISFKARASTLQGRALATYAVPNFLGRPKANFLFTALADKTRDVRTFTSQRYEAGLQVEQRASRITSMLYRYSFRKVLVDPNSLRIDPQQVPLFSQPTRISGFGITWIRDRRDNPAEAQKGDFYTVDVSYNAKQIGSSASFVRAFIQSSSFHRVSRNLVFARSARFGVQEPFSDTTPVEIPLPERFFAGGGNTLRGLGLNQAGPRDTSTGFPVGGLALLVFNNELRFPMRLPKLGNQVGGAIFYDGGNVYSRAGHVNFRIKPESPDLLNYFSHTIGFGVRYATPIGPVRLDIGYNLNPARFELCEASTTPTVPRCPAGQALTTRQLPRFQFFFNIGSIF